MKEAGKSVDPKSELSDDASYSLVSASGSLSEQEFSETSDPENESDFHYSDSDHCNTGIGKSHTKEIIYGDPRCFMGVLGELTESVNKLNEMLGEMKSERKVSPVSESANDQKLQISIEPHNEKLSNEQKTRDDQTATELVEVIVEKMSTRMSSILCDMLEGFCLMNAIWTPPYHIIARSRSVEEELSSLKREYGSTTPQTEKDRLLSRIKFNEHTLQCDSVFSRFRQGSYSFDILIKNYGFVQDTIHSFRCLAILDNPTITADDDFLAQLSRDAVKKITYSVSKDTITCDKMFLHEFLDELYERALDYHEIRANQ